MCIQIYKWSKHLVPFKFLFFVRLKLYVKIMQKSVWIIRFCNYYSMLLINVNYCLQDKNEYEIRTRSVTHFTPTEMKLQFLLWHVFKSFSISQSKHFSHLYFKQLFSKSKTWFGCTNKIRKERNYSFTVSESLTIHCIYVHVYAAMCWEIKNLLWLVIEFLPFSCWMCGCYF